MEREQDRPDGGEFSANLTVFVHIFKTAGTSLHEQMRRHYGFAAVPRVNDGFLAGESFDRRLQTELRKPETRAIAGHFTYARVSAALDRSSYRGQRTFFTFLRDPIERIISAYNYFSITRTEKWHREANEMGFGEFLLFARRNDAEMIEGHLCRYVSFDGSADFASAIQDLDRRFAFVGLIEDFNATRGAFEKCLGFNFDADLRRNSSPQKIRRSEISNEAMDLLLSITEEDRKLYEFVKAKGARNGNTEKS